MAEPEMGAQGGDDSVELVGYKPELRRTLGSLQVLAISTTFISVAVGIFKTYDVVVERGGSFSTCLWIRVAVGQVLAALAFAQFVAAIPLGGASYQRGSRLANPKIGWGRP